MTTAYNQGWQAFEERDIYDCMDGIWPTNPYAGKPKQAWIAAQWQNGYDNANEYAYERSMDYNEGERA